MPMRQYSRICQDGSFPHTSRPQTASCDRSCVLSSSYCTTLYKEAPLKARPGDETALGLCYRYLGMLYSSCARITNQLAHIPRKTVSISKAQFHHIRTLNMASSTWQEKAAAKQQSSFHKIPKEWRLPAAVTETLQKPLAEHSNRILELDIPRKSGIMSEKEIEITENFTVEELLNKLRDGVLSALEVTLAFSKRAALAQQLVRKPFETLAHRTADRSL